MTESIKTIFNSQWQSDLNNSSLPQHWIRQWLLHCINQSSSFLITDSDYELTEDEYLNFVNGIKKMQEGIPLAYLMGTQEFWSLDFAVNEHTLIPRPDTEVLVEQTLTWLHTNLHFDDLNILDLGTGSGCIAISLAHELRSKSINNQPKKWQVLAVDMSLEALKIAKQNVKQHNLDNKVLLFQSSWYEIFDDPENIDLVTRRSIQTPKKFDIICSNPPYIDSDDEHVKMLISEPITALTAEDSGMADIVHIVNYATKFLKTGGLLIVEHGYNQGEKVKREFVNNGFIEVQTVQDYGGNDRVTMGRLENI